MEYSVNGFDWQSTGQFDDLTAGGYTPQVRYPNSNCITFGTGLNLNPGTSILIDDYQTVAAGCGIDNGSIAIIVTTGVGLEYTINNGASWQTDNFFNGLAAGTYSPGVRQVGGGCETFGDEVEVEQADSPEIQNVTFSNPTACDVNDGEISITASSAMGTVEYSINTVICTRACIESTLTTCFLHHLIKTLSRLSI